MKRITFLAAIISGFLLLGAQSALAVPFCVGASPTGVPDAGECLINASEVRTGTFDLDGTLRITGNGRIDASGGGITFNICVAPAAPRHVRPDPRDADRGHGWPDRGAIPAGAAFRHHDQREPQRRDAGGERDPRRQHRRRRQRPATSRSPSAGT